MNSDKFDRIVLDLLYGELDELTTAAAKRHMDQSARAREIYAHFRATRQLSVLPTHSPPPGFEADLLEREARLLAELPLRHRLGRIVSKLAGYAMRPQLIMGALLLLMIGSSLMFVRARPGSHSPVQITERGAPEADLDVAPRAVSLQPPLPATPAAAPLAADQASRAGKVDDAAKNAPSAPPDQDGARVAAATSAGGNDVDGFDRAVQLYRSGGYLEAQRSFERIAQTGGKHAAEAELYSARAARATMGCAAALPGFERVRSRFPGSPVGADAAWRYAECLERLGQLESARRAYESLLEAPSHARRAQKALGALGGPARAATGRAPAPGAQLRGEP